MTLPTSKDLAMAKTPELLNTLEAVRAEIERRFYNLYDQALEDARAEVKGPKAHDYNSGGIRFQDHFANPLFAFYRLKQEVLRIESLLNSGKSPKCEPIDDNLIGIINHAAIFRAARTLKGE